MKKLATKLIAIFLVFVMLSGFVPLGSFNISWLPGVGGTALAVDGGYGSNGKFLAPIDPPIAGSIPISDRAGLEAIADDLSGNYHLTQDIDLSGAEWVPIGNNISQFTGTFDGQGFVIKNMEITESYDFSSIGLFGVANGGIYSALKNIALEDIFINVFETYGPTYVGGICGFSDMSISNCYVSGSIATDGHSAGGISGGGSNNVNSAPVSYCYNLAEILVNSISGSACAGGISGYMSLSPVECCFNFGDVQASASAAASNSQSQVFAGGICGVSFPISKCYNVGNISARSLKTETGYFESSTSFLVGAGGISGFSNSTWPSIDNSYNVGNISAFSDVISYVGESSVSVGGIVGLTYNNLRNCYNVGEIEISSVYVPSYIGGICGLPNISSNVSNCYAIFNYGCAYEHVLTYTQMKDAINFVDWNFDDVWDIFPAINDGYPFLRSILSIGGDQGGGLNYAETPALVSPMPDISVEVGETATLNVSASVAKGELSYQWYSNTERSNTGGTIITGATNASYSAPTDVAGFTFYFCVITNTDNDATINKTATFTTGASLVEVTPVYTFARTELLSFYYNSPHKKNLDNYVEPRASGNEISTDGIFYDDEYFKDGSIYNHELAVLSLTLAMSAFNSAEIQNDYSKDIAGKNVYKLLADIGFGENGIDISMYEGRPQQNSIAAAFASRQIYDGSTLIAIAVRGGGYESEWAGNFNVTGSKGSVHNGFGIAADSVYQELINYIWQKEIIGNVKVWITGYSRAGAVANLVAARLVDGYLTDDVPGIWMNRYNVFAYTFEAPNNTTSAQALGPEYRHIFNIVNPIDMVPKVPQGEWNYKKYGSLLMIPSAETTDSLFRDNRYKVLNIYEKLISDSLYRLPQMSGQGARLDDLFKEISERTHWSANDNKAQLLLAKIRGDILSANLYTPADLTDVIAIILNNLPLYLPLSLYALSSLDINYSQEAKDLIKAHDPELTLAWMLTLSGEEYPGDGKYRKLLVACPVDIDVYDSDNQRVAQAINDSITDISSSFIGAYTYEDENGEMVKAFILPPDEEYNIEILATDDGTMTYELSEIDAVTGVRTALVAYDNVLINKNDKFSGLVENLNFDTPLYPLEKIPDVFIEPTRTSETAVEFDKNELTWDVIKGENTSISAVTRGLVLPSIGSSGSIIMWASSDDSVIDEFGNVTQPPVGSGDRNVAVTATIFIGDNSETVVFNLTVIAVSSSDTPVNDDGGGSTSIGGNTTPANPSDNFSGSSAYVKDSGLDFAYILQDIFFHLSKVMVDNTLLTRDRDYRAEEGSTKITLLPSYLDTLEEGAHTLTVDINDNTSVTSQFTVKAASAAVTPITPTMPINPFSDVFGTDWFIDAVIYVYNNGLMIGTSTEPMLFSPRSPTTRGMIVTILYRMAGNTDVSSLANPFNDVAAEKYFTDAIKWAAANDIIFGVGGGKFDPNAPVSRQDLAVILTRYSDFIENSLPTTRKYPGFNDDAGISSYAKEAVERFSMAGIIDGYPDGSFKPLSDATRAEVATMLMKFVKAMA